MNADIWVQIQPAITSLVGAAVTALAAVGIAYINALRKKALEHISNMQDEKASRLLQDAVNSVHQLVTTIVTSIEQEEKPEILKAIEDGKITKDELRDLKKIAIGRVQGQLNQEYRKILDETFGNLSEYISDLVSQAVFELKLAEKK